MAQVNLVKFIGNCPANVNKDAKYSVKYDSGSYVVGIYYRTLDGEIWYPISDDHPELVAAVNSIKEAVTGSLGGAFYINEFRQVIVPVVGDEKDYYLAGEYHKDLAFEFEGKVISGNAVDLDGKPLQPGDPWQGPHPGIPYTLAAGGKDVYFRYSPRPRVEKEVKLSQVITTQKAAIVAKGIADIKGNAGGRFYVNEYQQIFAPRTGDYGVEYIYVGKVNLENWFQKPEMIVDEIAVAEPPPRLEATPDPADMTTSSLQAKVVHIKDGDTGHTYKSLFGDYLSGATEIELVEPYIRENYQIRNFRDFCLDLIGDTGEVITVRLFTKADTSGQKTEISRKLENLKEALADRGIDLQYNFTRAKHERWIIANNGWKIILTRGIDIYGRPDTNCGVEEVNQSFRKCKENHITYEKISR